MELLPLLLLFAVMYFLLIRPQKQRVRAQQALVKSLDVGDEVVTVGGVLGRIVRIDDETAELETTPGVILRFRRSAISAKATQTVDVTDTNGNGDPQAPGDEI